MKFGILVFPGTWSDRDCGYALQSLGQEIEYVWHADTMSIGLTHLWSRVVFLTAII